MATIQTINGVLYVDGVGQSTGHQLRVEAAGARRRLEERLDRKLPNCPKCGRGLHCRCEVTDG